MHTDDALDLVLTVIILGIVVAIGLSLAFRTEKKAREDTQILSEDKNTKSIRGYGIDDFGTFDGTLTSAEVALTIASILQDSTVTKDKEITIYYGRTLTSIELNQIRNLIGENDYVNVANDRLVIKVIAGTVMNPDKISEGIYKALSEAIKYKIDFSLIEAGIYKYNIDKAG